MAGSAAPDEGSHMKSIKRIALVLVLLWLAFAAGPAARPASAQSGESPEPVVHALMFWMDTCGHCHYVLESVLPPLQEQYGAQLDITLVEIASREDADRMLAVAAELGLPPGGVGVPFLVIGERYLIGSDQVEAELPGLIEAHLAAGGVELPSLPTLEGLVPAAEPAVLPPAPAPEATAAAPEAVVAAPEARAVDGAGVALVVLLAMILVLAAAAGGLWLARAGRIQSTPAARLWLAVPILSVLGLGVAAYLAYVETQAASAVCGPVGDCNAVQSSSYARVLGVPIGLIGVAGYVAILAVWAWARRSASALPVVLLVLMTGFGVAFSIYLTYLELFVIRAVCMWCVTSAVVMTLLLLVSVWLAVGAATQPRPRAAMAR